MDESELAEVQAARQAVRATPGVFLVGLHHKAGQQKWTAAVAHDEMRHESVIHMDDPAVFSAEHVSPGTAVKLALEKALSIPRIIVPRT